METSPIVQYLQDQITAGFSEDILRQHLQAYGWTTGAIDEAFVAFEKTRSTAQQQEEVQELSEAPAPKRYRSFSLPRKVWFGATAVFIAAVGVSAYFVLFAHRPSAMPTVSAQKLTYQQQQSSDVAYLATTIVQYVHENNSQLPVNMKPNLSGTALVLCGEPCASTQFEVGVLGVYKPANIAYKPYDKHLTVPDKTSIYAVRGAACDGKQGIGGENSKQNALVLLYATADKSSLKQRCLAL